MNNLPIPILSLFFVLLISCAPKKKLQKIDYRRTGEVKCIQYEKDIIKLESTSRASTMGEASSFAERNAIENLLFKGIPKSNAESPLIADEHESLRRNKRFYDVFIMQKEYEKFIMESSISSEAGNPGQYRVTQYIELDLKAMRKHLESNKVIRKFGI